MLHCDADNAAGNSTDSKTGDEQTGGNLHGDKCLRMIWIVSATLRPMVTVTVTILNISVPMRMPATEAGLAALCGVTQAKQS
jgi:hypothetical protein